MPYTTSSDGARIYFEVHGTGDPVLMIMGLGSNAYGWKRSLPWISAGHQAIVFDNRGVGRSDVPGGAYTIEQMAKQLQLERYDRRGLQAGLAAPRDHLDGENRVAAELEEVVVDADPGHAEHLGPDPGEQVLRGRPGCDVSPSARVTGEIRRR